MLQMFKVGMTIGADADGAVIDGCVFRDSADKEFLVALQATAASTDLTIINNDVHDSGCWHG